MSKLSIVGNNLLLFQNSNKTNSKFTQKFISKLSTQLFQYHKMSISHNPEYHNYSKTWFQFQSKFQLTNTKNHNQFIPNIITKWKPITHFQYKNSSSQFKSQFPTVTKNLSPGRVVLSAPLPTLSGAWWLLIGHCWSLLHLQQQVVHLSLYLSNAFRRT